MLRSLLQVLFGIDFLGWLVEEKEESPKKMQVSDPENLKSCIVT